MDLDPWLFEDRIRLFALLIEQTHLFLTVSPSVVEYAQDPLASILNVTLHDDNLLFGFLIQFLWQAKSGRLQLTLRNDGYGHNISITSWWAGVNYYLSVIPLFGAQKAGWNPTLNMIRIVPDMAHSTPKFLTSKDGPFVDDCQVELVDRWCLYFLKIQDLRNQAAEESSLLLDSTRLSELSQLMWNAHNASVRYAASILISELKLNPLDEQLFGMGWAFLVGVFAENNPIVTTRHQTTKANDLMFPPRLLRLGDDLCDLSSKQQEFVRFLHGLARTTDRPIARL